MPISIEIISILIWTVPLVLLGFLFGAGYFRKLIPPSGCVLMLAGWAMGMASMIAVALSFPAEFAVFITRVTLERVLADMFGRTTRSFIVVNPWLLVLGLILILSVVATIIYDKIMRPRK